MLCLLMGDLCLNSDKLFKNSKNMKDSNSAAIHIGTTYTSEVSNNFKSIQ